MDSDIVDIFDMLQNGTAYNKDCVVQTQGVSQNMGELSAIIDLFGFDELKTYAQQLDLYKTGAMANLDSHLNYLYDNLPSVLSLVSSYITDMADAERLPGFSISPEDNPIPGALGGGYVNLSGVSARAIMLGAPMAMMAPETGSGSGGSQPGGGVNSSKCSSMGDAFGSIMGKASQFMGQAMGMLGQIQGIVGGMMGGGVLGAISKFANLGALSGIPGIGQLNSLVSGGFAQIGNLGQMGGLISAIGQGAGIGQLGQLGQMLGGNVSPLNAIGGLMQTMGAFSQRSSTLGAGLGAFSVPDLRSQLTEVNIGIYQSVPTPLINALNLVARDLEDLLNQTSSTKGNVSDFIVQLRGMASFLQEGRLAQIGDITPLLNDLTQFASNLTQYVQPSESLTKLITDIQALVEVLRPINNMSGLVSEVNAMNGALYDMGGRTGYGNVNNMIGQAAGLVGRLGSLGGILNMVPGLGAVTGALGQVQGLIGALGNVASGNIGGIIGSMTGMLGSMKGIMGSIPGLSGIMGSLGGLGGIGSILGGQGLGGIGQMLGGLMGSGGLGGIMGGIGSMIAGEKGMLNAAQGALGSMAGAYNLKLLKGNDCANGVLNNVGTDALNKAAGSGSGSGGSGSGGGSGGSGGGSGTSDFSPHSTGGTPAVPYTNDAGQLGFGGGLGKTGPLFDPNISGGGAPGSVTDFPPTIPFQGPSNSYPDVVDGVPQDLPTRGDGTNPYAGRLYD